MFSLVPWDPSVLVDALKTRKKEAIWRQIPFFLLFRQGLASYSPPAAANEGLIIT